MTTITDNALHAAATWLERIAAHREATAVVNIAPAASLGTWDPGADNVSMLPGIDDAGAELLEAVAPVVQAMLEDLGDEARAATVDSLLAGARLQVLLLPPSGSIIVRLTKGTKTVLLGASMCDEVAH